VEEKLKLRRNRSDAEAWRDEENELKEAPTALGSDAM
jgi:hypothetical protein